MDSTFQWQLRHPDTEPATDRFPCARVAYGGILTYRNQLYMFGGFGPKGDFLPEEVNGPQLNDLWCFDLTLREWQCIQAHDGSKDYTDRAGRPGVRRIPGMVAQGDEIYLFGGFDLSSGPNDDGPTSQTTCKRIT